MSPTRRELLHGGGGLAALLTAAALTGCSSRPQASAEVGFARGDGSVTLIAPDKRVDAPTLSGRSLDDRPLSTSQYAGTMMVLNVWGSWCAPCRKEAPDLVRAAAQNRHRAQFLGLNTRDLDRAPAQAFQRAFQVDYPSFFDPDGQLLLAFHQLPAQAIPSTLVIDTQGRVAARVLGQTSAATLSGILDDVVAGK